MARSHQVFPIVDLFAGPGGLGEGFSSFVDELDNFRFQLAASIECDGIAFETLRLRHFLNSFPGRKFPEDYYRFIRCEISLEELYTLYPKNKASADSTALNYTLGKDDPEFVRKEISKRLAGSKCWALVGGPPCQAYSIMGRSRMKGDVNFEDDERHYLYREYLEIIKDHAPPVFVMENVKGLLSAKVKGESIIDRILSDLENPSVALEGVGNGVEYKLFSLSEEEKSNRDGDPRQFLVRAENYGVPQARHRIFILGIRNDVLYHVRVSPGKLRPHKPPKLVEVIENLPKIRSGISSGQDSFTTWCKEISETNPDSIFMQINHNPNAAEIAAKLRKKATERQRQFLQRQSTRYPPRRPSSNHNVFDLIHDPRSDFLNGHESRGHMPSDLRRYAFASSFASVTNRSPKLADFPHSLLPEHTNVKLGQQGRMFTDRFRVQLPDNQATTITSHISKDGHYYIHYDIVQCRSLTVREAARLQTFPDSYVFLGPRTAQFHQVGNAVPPYLAQQIAAIVFEILNRIK